MTKEEKLEQEWDWGYRAAMRSILGKVLVELKDDPDISAERLLAERADAIATLRRLCKEYGDNDWPDKLHLSDIIEKHLIRPMLRK